jgi:L-threonylcarbamoyladenylate synthase
MSFEFMEIQPADEQVIARAAVLLRQGSLVAIPTETVYGLGADATNDEAVAAIFAAKARPQFNPLIVHVPSFQAAEKYVEFSPLAAKLGRHFWPGALTLVLPRKQNCGLSLLVSAGLDTVAVRVPAAPVSLAIIKQANVPVAAPSANLSGTISPTTAEHVERSLGAAVDLIVDAGTCDLGLESTIVGFVEDAPVLLRPGAISTREIEDVAGQPLGTPTVSHKTPQSPGQLPSHYAPRAQLRLNAIDIQSHETLLGFGPHMPAISGLSINLSEAGNLDQAAARLFSALHELDRTGVDTIAVMPIPQTGLGEAINDRLTRAAAPRDGS